MATRVVDRLGMSRIFVRFVYFMIFATLFCESTGGEVQDESEDKIPTVVIAIFARNKAHTLPYFLTLLERLEYPKERISLWVRSDHNEDNTLEILRKWLSSVEGSYHSVNAELLSSPPTRLGDEDGPAHWTPSRFTHIIQLREEALVAARQMWTDYIWFLDSDVFIVNPKTLQLLIKKGHTVTAPMLKSDGLYSNFWCGMTDEYYYLRTDDYKPTLNRERIGCFDVPMVHSSVLINLRRKSSDNLTFIRSKVPDYEGPNDDIIIFALAANKSGIPLYICNDEVYGFVMVPLEQGDSLAVDYTQLTNLKLEVLVENPPLPVSDLLSEYVSYPLQDTMGFDLVYMINLLRRPERRIRMNNCFRELGIHAYVINGVDGRKLNESSLNEWNIHMMPEYSDPYHKRPLTMGEVGCFLSHYNIWRHVVENGFREVMVLEDDIRFEPFFRQKVLNIMAEIRELNLHWDLVYLGRKRLHEAEEPWVPGSRYLVTAGYSYWTLGYLLSQSGARKLLDGKPLRNLVPVDEYLPILFDKHPQVTWKGYFPQRDLAAFSAAPLLVYPTHYTGEKGYVSDTEDSTVINERAERVREDL
ncbi:glycosyltransferase 25 family member [Anabrus simplex]|uniref:glycosyltransferase 25 family member n=1 Tax=Anabrus simplex TaxID=316456 RepID=UPI0034DDC943